MSVRVLAICIHNSARSQMTEEFIRSECGETVEVSSAGIEPGTLNPLVVKLLAEDHGIDISKKSTQSVFALHESGRSFDYVIAVCDPEAAEACPIFPAEKKRLHWPFPDPSRLTGTEEERLAALRPIRDQILNAVRGFCADIAEA